MTTMVATRLRSVFGPCQCPMEQAVAHNHHHVLTYLVDQGMKMSKREMTVVVECGAKGHLDMIKRLVDDHSFITSSDDNTRMLILRYAMCGAWKSGNMQIVDYVESMVGDVMQDDIFTSSYMNYKTAFKTGNLEFFKKVYQWLGPDHADFGDPNWNWEAFIKADGQLEMIQWMADKMFALDVEGILLSAVRYGSVALAMFCPLSKLSPRLMGLAVDRGHLDMVHYLHAECENDFQGVNTRLSTISLDVLEYLAANRPQDQPIEFTDLKLNTWPDRRWVSALQSVGMPMCDRYIEFMIVNLDMDEIIKLLGKDVANLISVNMLNVAIGHDRLEHVKWILENETSMEMTLTMHALDRAIEYEKPMIVEYIVENNKSIRIGLQEFGLAVQRGDVDMLKYLVISNGGVLAVNTSALGILGAVQNGHSNLVNYLFLQRPHTNGELSVYLDNAKNNSNLSTYINIHNSRNQSSPIDLLKDNLNTYSIPLTPIEGYILNVISQPQHT
eukprot:gene15971-18992_t